MINFFYPGDIVPQGRPRVGRVGSFVKVYEDKNSRNFKTQFAAFVRMWLSSNHPDYQLLYDAVSLELRFYLLRPESISAKKRPDPIVKPDIDNLVKSVVDACKDVLWHDDRQIVSLMATKEYSDKPGLSMTVAAKE